MIRPITVAILSLALLCSLTLAQEGPSMQLSEPWPSAYTGDDATGDSVIGLWSFDGANPGLDSSGNGHDGVLKGAEVNPAGKFGACLECFRGWPDEDKEHRLYVNNAATLSPKGAFTIEMWISPKDDFEGYPEAFLIDKKYVSPTDYQIVLGAASSSGTRILRASLGFGAASETFASTAAQYEAGKWYHIAFTYDGDGTGKFYRNGSSLGGASYPGRKSIAAGTRFLTIGDRNGSNYHGFPGYIDEVRISNGAREFRPASFAVVTKRRAYVRMEEDIVLEFAVTNRLRTPLTGVTVRLGAAETDALTEELEELAPGETAIVEYPLNTALRPGEYNIHARMDIAGEQPYSSDEAFKVVIAPRPVKRMPVVMWGVGGVDGVTEETPRLKEMGFTHCLGTGTDLAKVWNADAPTLATSEEGAAKTYAMLDQALEDGIGVIAGLSPGRYARDYEEYLRVDRNDEAEKDVNGLLPKVQNFCYNVGKSAGETYGDFPAFAGALVHTEVRGEASPSFSKADCEAFTEYAGYDIPEEVQGKNGVRYQDLKDFPTDRVIADDDPILVYYKWFWEKGDGWNALHTKLNDGLKSATRPEFWTFHDPAVRVASRWGNGGNVDYLSQWTYSYPDPIRIGLATDELFAMADGAETDQQVMKMTQIIWYRAQTAPMPGTEAQVTDAFFDDHDKGPQGEVAEDAAGYRARWEKEIPDAPFITIAPMHLREAFWTKMSRPIQGIMYHGWQSLVDTDSTSGYRYTNPATRHELARLTSTVLEPLGPALMQVKDRPADVAFLESFASQMFARRGTYGWNGGWMGDAYNILAYAQLQPEVVYDQTIERDGLEQFKVLVMVDCDVLTETIVEAVENFQAKGGIIVGDENLCPAIKPDILLQSYSRPKEADKARQLMQEKAAALRQELDAHYSRYAESSNSDVVTRCRQHGGADYVFAVNDLREYGDYVGQHGLVMENGLPSDTVISVSRNGGVVYDLVSHKQVKANAEDGKLAIGAHVEPCGGRLFMIVDKAIGETKISGPENAVRGQQVTMNVTVSDVDGQPVDAMVPLHVQVMDPEGQAAEFSGYYGADDGRLQLTLDIAPNDRPGIWTVKATELAAGTSDELYVRVSK